MDQCGALWSVLQTTVKKSAHGSTCFFLAFLDTGENKIQIFPSVKKKSQHCMIDSMFLSTVEYCRHSTKSTINRICSGILESIFLIHV